VANVEKENASIKRCYRYLPIRLGNSACSALLDSSNLWRNTMSKQFFDRHGLTKKDRRPVEVTPATAVKKRADLKVVEKLWQPICLPGGGLPAHLQLGATEIKAEKMLSEGGAADGDIPFRETTDTLTWRDALVSIDNEGHFVGGLLRPFDYPICEEDGRRSDTRIRLLRNRLGSTQEEDELSTPWDAWPFQPRPAPLATARVKDGRLMKKGLRDLSPDLPQPYVDDICIHSSDLPLRFMTLGRVGDDRPLSATYNQRNEPEADGTRTPEGEASEAPLNGR
jgi:hypothetical protein